MPARRTPGPPPGFDVPAFLHLADVSRQSVKFAASALGVRARRTSEQRVNFFMNKFRRLGFVEYTGGLKINNSLLTIVLHD